MSAALRNEWKGTDLAETAARLIVVWLRPRDVRSGDAAHRPREMRQSCRLKAVGCGGDRDSLCLVTDVFCSGDNIESSSIKRTANDAHWRRSCGPDIRGG